MTTTKNLHITALAFNGVIDGRNAADYGDDDSHGGDLSRAAQRSRAYGAPLTAALIVRALRQERSGEWTPLYGTVAVAGLGAVVKAAAAATAIDDRPIRIECDGITVCTMNAGR